jgi:hypothetical protein
MYLGSGLGCGIIQCGYFALRCVETRRKVETSDWTNGQNLIDDYFNQKHVIVYEYDETTLPIYTLVMQQILIFMER